MKTALILGIAVSAAAMAQTPNYSQDIAPIVYNNCTTCHRTGQVTPFTLMSYSDVKQHAPTVAAVTQSGYMPPWKPDSGWTAFRDQRSLTAAQISLIQQWVAAGMPQGDPSLEPPLPTFTDGWQLGTPDLVLTMPAGFSVPADGPDIYRNFVLRTGLTTENWIKAIELKPSARGAVHHVLFYSDTTGKARAMDGLDGQPGFPGFGAIFLIEAIGDPANAITGGLGGWVPGTTPEFLPTGIAYHLPANADLVLQTHFHPDGKPETEQTTMGIYFTTPPARTITQIQVPAAFGVESHIDIPAGVSDYLVRGSFTLPVDVDAFSVSAHCHYLGKGTRMTATLPNGQVQVLLSIQDWDFNWQDTYIFKDTVALPKGTRIDGELVYDNSAGNPNNPLQPAAGSLLGRELDERNGQPAAECTAARADRSDHAEQRDLRVFARVRARRRQQAALHRRRSGGCRQRADGRGKSGQGSGVVRGSSGSGDAGGFAGFEWRAFEQPGERAGAVRRNPRAAAL